MLTRNKIINDLAELIVKIPQIEYHEWFKVLIDRLIAYSITYFYLFFSPSIAADSFFFQWENSMALNHLNYTLLYVI